MFAFIQYERWFLIPYLYKHDLQTKGSLSHIIYTNESFNDLLKSHYQSRIYSCKCSKLIYKKLHFERRM